MTTLPLDLFVDLNTMDETGLPWSYVDQATDQSKIRVGTFIVVGGGLVRGVARVVDIAGDGVVHVLPMPGPPSDHLHLLGGPAGS
jgi:hypothetical protein